MPTPKDELFGRLALRQGYLNKEQAVELIRSYREEGKVGQDIGAFALHAGWLQAPEVDQIEGAIAHRAEGHVSTTKRRVPKVGQGGGRRALPRRSAPREGAAASPAQIAMISIGAIVLIGCVLFLVFKFQSGDAPTPADTTTQKSAPETVDIKPAKPVEPEVPKGPIVLSPEELENLENRVNEAIMAARQGIERSPFKALNRLEADRERLGGEQMPARLLDEIKTQEQEIRTTIADRYQELLNDAKEAKAAGQATQLGHALEDIAEQCGPEYRAKAEEAVK